MKCGTWLFISFTPSQSRSSNLMKMKPVLAAPAAFQPGWRGVAPGRGQATKRTTPMGHAWASPVSRPCMMDDWIPPKSATIQVPDLNPDLHSPSPLTLINLSSPWLLVCVLQKKKKETVCVGAWTSGLYYTLHSLSFAVGSWSRSFPLVSKICIETSSLTNKSLAYSNCSPLLDRYTWCAVVQ